MFGHIIQKSQMRMEFQHFSTCKKSYPCFFTFAKHFAWIDTSCRFLFCLLISIKTDFVSQKCLDNNFIYYCLHDIISKINKDARRWYQSKVLMRELNLPRRGWWSTVSSYWMTLVAGSSVQGTASPKYCGGGWVDLDVIGCRRWQIRWAAISLRV
jgi:hypothetical protein